MPFDSDIQFYSRQAYAEGVKYGRSALKPLIAALEKAKISTPNLDNDVEIEDAINELLFLTRREGVAQGLKDALSVILPSPVSPRPPSE